MGVGGAVGRDLKSKEEIIATSNQFCSHLRLLPRLDPAGELGRGEGLKRSFHFLKKSNLVISTSLNDISYLTLIADGVWLVLQSTVLT